MSTTQTKHGWPMVPSTHFVDELTPSCPQCGNQTEVWMGVLYAPIGTGSRGQGRLGDPGAMNYIECRICGKKDVY